MNIDDLWSGGQAYDVDRDLMLELGLKTNFNRDWTDVGTVTIGNSTVKVEVAAMPAQFFRFTIRRPVEGKSDVYERFVMSTGSGSFGEYWPAAKHLALNCLDVERLGEGKETE
jgi:hypothetical protein